MCNRLLLSSRAAAFTVILTGCASAPSIVLEVTPPLVCPGDIVVLHLETTGHTQARVTVRDPPVSGHGDVLIDRSDGTWSTDRPAQICQTTHFDLESWTGDQTECGQANTSCARSTANVVFDEVPIPP